MLSFGRPFNEITLANAEAKRSHGREWNKFFLAVPASGALSSSFTDWRCWLVVPLPLPITNALFIKRHPLVVLSRSLACLAKFFVAALVVASLFA
jgi:hypothetical protein